MRTWKTYLPFFLLCFVLISGLLLRSFAEQHAVSASGRPGAITVYGQPDFLTGSQHSTNADSLKNASALAADAHGGFYVADYGNSRVLHFAAAHGVAKGADRVYGQPNFFASSPYTGPTGLNYPHGVAVGIGGDLYIADMFNNRVLHFPTNKTSANQVLGQYNFYEGHKNSRGLSAHSLCHPQGLALDSTGLYVADTDNNRVLHFPFGRTLADRVYGQGALNNFTSNRPGSGTRGLSQPRDVAVNSSGLFIADSGNNRVVHYPFKSTRADFIYGQANFSPRSIAPNHGHPLPDASTLNNPTGLALDKKGGLYIADRNNNRVLYFAPRSKKTRNGPAAIRVYGQPRFTINYKASGNNSFDGPGGIAINAAGQLFVLDIFHQRVLEFAPLRSALKRARPVRQVHRTVVFGPQAFPHCSASFGMFFSGYLIMPSLVTFHRRCRQRQTVQTHDS